MRLTAKLALAQIERSKTRTLWTMLGVILCVAMVTAICGFAASGMATFQEVAEGREQDQVNRILISLASVLGGIVALASVVVVSNAFRASAGERTTQFGLLKSTGATKRQIAATVMYEGLFFSAVGIPLGLLLGILIQFAGLSIANHMLSYINAFFTEDGASGALILRFTLSPFAILAAALASFATVLLSAWLPARKAAKIPAIDAIRRTGDVKLKRSKVKTSRIVRLLSGVEGTLAQKSLKRSRRSFRATVVSIAISIVMLLAAASLQIHMSQLNDLAVGGVDATAAVSYYDPDGVGLPLKAAELMTERLRSYGGARVYGAGQEISSYRLDMEGTPYSVFLLTADRQHYEELCRQAGIFPGGNILLNLWREYEGPRMIQTNPFGNWVGWTLSLEDILQNKPGPKLTVDGALSEVPNELTMTVGTQNVYIIVPELETDYYIWNALTEDATDFLLYAEEVGKELLDGQNVSYINYQMQSQIAMRMSNLISLFAYGFAGLLVLIGLTNVVSTISANTRLRRREFAALQSVGMTQGGLNRMLTLESILCSARALLFGLPLGIFAAWLVHLSVTSGDYGFAFTVPWLAVGECVVGVFIVTFVSMRFAAFRLRKANTVEAIRTEDGV
ncbi:MAG: ABC transporter permease [Oscillospiraceae bacterium]|jgi:putative ABC transport system permease protein|nr:ABC transporter permease [Oscillospiraceae bacterium]